MNEKPTVRAHAAPWNRSIQLLVSSEGRAGFHVAKITWEKHSREMVEAPTLDLYHAEAQTLMDDLWQAGLRPTEGSGSAGQLAATQRHLEDMRTLALKLPRK